MFYCPDCNDTFDVTRTIPERALPQEGGGLDIAAIIKRAQENILKVEEIGNVDIETITKNQIYKKLTVKQREHVFNKLSELMQIDKTKLINNREEAANQAYFICKKCGYFEPIKPGTLIFSKTSSDITQEYITDDYKDVMHDPTLPHTRNYICPNKKCKSHEDYTLREAVFVRVGNTYRTRYICKTCTTTWT